MSNIGTGLGSNNSFKLDDRIEYGLHVKGDEAGNLHVTIKIGDKEHKIEPLKIALGGQSVDMSKTSEANLGKLAQAVHILYQSKIEAVVQQLTKATPNGPQDTGALSLGNHKYTSDIEKKDDSLAASNTKFIENGKEQQLDAAHQANEAMTMLLNIIKNERDSKLSDPPSLEGRSVTMGASASETEALQAKIKALEAENLGLQSQNALLVKERGSQLKEIADLKGKISELITLLGNAHPDDADESLYDQIDQVKSRILSLTDEIDRAKFDNKTLKEELSTVRSENESLREKNQALSEQVKNLTARVGELDQEIGQRDNRIKELENQIAKAREKLNPSGDGNEDLEGLIASLQEKLKANQESIGELTTQRNEAQKALTQTQKELNASQTENASLKEALKSTKAELKGAQDLLGTLNTELARTQSLCSELGIANTSLIYRLGQLQNSASNTEKNLFAANSENARLTNKLLELTGEKKELTQNIKELTSRLQTLTLDLQTTSQTQERQIKDLKTQLKDSERKFSTLQETEGNLRTQIANQGNEITELKGALESAGSEISGLQEQIKGLTSGLALAQLDAAEAKAKHASAKAELETAKGTLESRDIELSELSGRAKELSTAMRQAAEIIGDTKMALADATSHKAPKKKSRESTQSVFERLYTVNPSGTKKTTDTSSIHKKAWNSGGGNQLDGFITTGRRSADLTGKIGSSSWE